MLVFTLLVFGSCGGEPVRDVGLEDGVMYVITELAQLETLRVTVWRCSFRCVLDE